MPQVQGAEILEALSKIKEPATFNEIVRHVASNYLETSEHMEELVQAALTAGVRYGFVQKHRDLYYAIKDAERALNDNACAESASSGEYDNEDIESGGSGESTCSCADHVLPLESTAATPKLHKDGVVVQTKVKEPNRRDDARTIKKHDSKHVDKKKMSRHADEDDRDDDEEEDDDDYSDDDSKHASTCPRDCAACAARKRAAAARRRKRKGRSRSRTRSRRRKY